MKRSHLAREIVETIALAVLIFIAVRFVVQSYQIDDASMQPGLHGSEFVMVNKVAYLFHAPQRGDVIVFHYPLDTSKDFIKRIIGLPGDTIRVDSTHVWVNNVELKEPYISQASNPQGQVWKVPANEYFVLGDNRPQSDDSRVWGFVPKYDIVGKAVMVYWPVSDWQFINTYPQVFAGIK